jgi:citrate lyase gamma subunit
MIAETVHESQTTIPVSPRVERRIADALLLRQTVGNIAAQMRMQIAQMEHEAQSALDAVVRGAVEMADHELPTQYMVRLNPEAHVLVLIAPGPNEAQNGVG